ncbi:MAG: hypothetical protein MHMPM18_001367 [Marteilia pararefringens]
MANSAPEDTNADSASAADHRPHHSNDNCQQQGDEAPPPPQQQPDLTNRLYKFTVDSPMIVEGDDRESKYTLYRIGREPINDDFKHTLNSGSVNRRFRDFKKLYKQLIDDGFCNLPKLPSQHINRQIIPKKSLFTDELHEKRMQEMLQFLTECDSMMIVTSTEPFRDFLTNSTY